MDIKSYVLGFAKGKAEGGSGDSGGSIVGSGDGLETRSGSFRAPNTYIAFFDESDLSKSTSYSHLYYGEFITDKTIETDKQYQLLDTIGIFTPFSKNISGLGTCVCFGNENILVNDTVEPGEQAFLIAYSPSTSKIVVFSLSVHSFTISGRSELLYRVTVPHGFNQKPDLIMVYSDSTTNSMGITSAWGYSSKYRSIIENLNHLTYTYTGWMGYSSVKGIDEEQTGSYLYCDETNFYLGGSIPFVCGGTYKWIAVTGLGSTGTSGSGDGTSTDERVKYVTFMYGATELIKYPVISGDTVHDPVAKGLIDAPTK